MKDERVFSVLNPLIYNVSHPEGMLPLYLRVPAERKIHVNEIQQLIFFLVDFVDLPQLLVDEPTQYKCENKHSAQRTASVRRMVICCL